jgi:hypothetical protein
MSSIARWGILIQILLWLRLKRICVTLGWLDGAYYTLRKARRLRQIYRDDAGR